MRGLKIILTITLFFSVAPSLIAQKRESRGKVVIISDLSDTLDRKKVEQYLNRVDEEIGKLVGQYPQLADWNRKRAGTDWTENGKVRSETSLAYAHGLKKVRSSNYLDWYGPDGFHLRIDVLTQRGISRLQGASIETVVMGSPLAGGCVVAGVMSANPKNPELEKKVTEIIKKRLSRKPCY